MHADGERAEEQAEQAALCEYDAGDDDEGGGVDCFEFAPVGRIGLYRIYTAHYIVCIVCTICLSMINIMWEWHYFGIDK